MDNLSLCLSAMCTRLKELPKDKRTPHIPYLAQATRSMSLLESTRSYAAETLNQLEQTGFEDMINPEYPVWKNKIKLRAYLKLSDPIMHVP